MQKRPDPGVCAELYRAMVRLRLAEQKIAELYPSDKIQSPIHLSLGQEAVSAGVGHALSPEDRLYGTYRGHGLYLAKGGDMRRMFAELYGKDTGCARGKGGSMHLVAPEVGLMACSAIVASTIPVAVGDALASEMQGRTRVVAAVFGDGGIDEGVFFESLNFAALKKLPILFILENNRYAIHSRVADRHARTDLYKIGEGLGVRGRRLDGNDAWTVHQAVSEAAAKVRSGGPPLLLEFTTFRWNEHVGPGFDFSERYRHAGEEKQAKAKDPLVLGRRRCLAAGLSKDRLDKIEKEAALEVDQAVRFAEESPFPAADRLLADVFA